MTKVNFNIALAQNVAMDKAMRGIRAATIEGQRITQVDILSSSPPRTGRLYRRGKTKFHQASSPGESPAPDSGQLRELTNVEFSKNGMVAIGKVVNNLEKAAMLQLGTEKIAPRPWISRLLGGEFRDRIKAAFVRGARL